MKNLTMLVDFYEFTMANGFYVHGHKDTKAVFEMFYRKNPDHGGYVIAAGLEQLIDFVSDMHFTEEDIDYLRKKGIFDEGFLDYLKEFRFRGTIEAVPEGTIVYPGTPLVTVTGNVIECQLLETFLLLTINHQSLIATKANRICRAAGDGMVMEFGARRAQGPDAAVLGARAAYIGGCHATATVLADQMYGVNAIGTMAHSWIQFFSSEEEAFRAYAKTYPDDCTLLIDTYDIIKGAQCAVKVAKEVLEPKGKRLKGVRIDSGDLAYFSKKLRALFDENGMEDCKIVVSNSIDEWLLNSMKTQGARIDSYGIGERLITAKSDPVFGGVYKLVAVEEEGKLTPRIKISENEEKITNPGKKVLWRLFNKTSGIGYADVLTLEEEHLDEGGSFYVIDPKKPWKHILIDNSVAVRLQKTIFEDGKLVYEKPRLEDIREYVKDQIENTVWEEELRLENPHVHYVDLSEKIYQIKSHMLQEAGKKMN